MTNKEGGKSTQDLVAELSLASLHGHGESQLSDRAAVGESPFFTPKDMVWGSSNAPSGSKTG